MAHVSTHAPVQIPVFGWVWQALTIFGNALVRLGEANPKYRQMQALQALSDAELANRGLRREDLARYVFSDSLWV